MRNLWVTWYESVLIYKPVSAATQENSARDTTKYLLKNHEQPLATCKGNLYSSIGIYY